MADLVITSLRGGLNEDPPIALADDNCVVAQNVEFVRSRLGERRRGSTAIDLTGSDLTGCTRVAFTFRHTPTTDPKDAQLWVLGITDWTPSTAVLAYKDTTWHTVTMADALTIDAVSEYQVQALSLHGKLYLAYNSAVDRLHVWDGTTLRRTGIAQPSAAPTGADTGAGTFSGTRYYRVRFTVQVSTVTTLRSEPSDVLTFAPSGSGTGVIVTRPTITGADVGIPHWELEASVDNANFYRVATTVIGTTTATDSQDYATGYAVTFTLSEDIGDYEVIPSVRYLSADEDRVLGGGSFEDAALASRVMWTPVLGASGVGNDERLETDTDPSVDLDNYDGGALTGLSQAASGYLFALKQSHGYQLSRSGIRTRAYEAARLTGQRGAIPGSIIDALDPTGNPVVLCLDGDVGPCRVSPRGIEPCGEDLIDTWSTVNLDATKVPARGVYFRENKQVHWWVPTGSSNVPDTRLVLHMNEMRQTESGWRRGWCKWSGPSAAVLTVCLFATNIDDDTSRSNDLVPFIGLEGSGLVWQTNTGTTDNGTAYAARVLSKPFVRGNVLHAFAVLAASLIAKAVTSAVVDVTLVGGRADEADIEKEVANVSFTAGSGEGARVIRHFDDLSLSELHTVQVEFEDSAAVGGRWELDLFVMLDAAGQRS